MPAFKPGQSGNPNGRKPGALNKKTIESVNRAQKMIEAIENDPKFKTMLEDMSVKEMRQMYMELLEYVTPKLSRVENDNSNAEPLVIRVLHSAEASRQQIENIIDITHE
jgi:Family of unknown function (DUF5681)